MTSDVPFAYACEARALDAEVLAVIGAWHRHGTPLEEARFDDLARRIFAHQLAYNPRYAAYCTRLGVSAASLPRSWQTIPAVPAAAFKEAALATFDPEQAALVFETSGTTGATKGRHVLENGALYDAALLAAFDRFMLPDGLGLRYLNLVPDPSERPHSSLGYMMRRICETRGDGRDGWYLRGESLLFDTFAADVRSAAAQGQPLCIATTAFALVHVLAEMERRGITFALPAGSRIMETGGFKGRTHVVERDELYRRAAAGFAVATGSIVAEYGMTELCSQYYDDVLVRPRVRAETRKKSAPPWLRTRVSGPDGRPLPDGSVGALVHVDLANRSSCVAVATEDLGAQLEDGLILIGRERGAAPRGCSLDAEDLLTL